MCPHQTRACLVLFEIENVLREKNELYKVVLKLFPQRSTDLLALLPCAMLPCAMMPRLARGT